MFNTSQITKNIEKLQNRPIKTPFPLRDLLLKRRRRMGLYILIRAYTPSGVHSTHDFTDSIKHRGAESVYYPMYLNGAVHTLVIYRSEQAGHGLLESLTFMKNRIWSNECACRAGKTTLKCWGEAVSSVNKMIDRCIDAASTVSQSARTGFKTFWRICLCYSWAVETSLVLQQQNKTLIHIWCIQREYNKTL